MPIFRFAPSPNGELHLGHAFSALLNQALASVAGGTLLVRLEDIDLARCSPVLEARLLDDLAWLGIVSAHPPRRQSEHFADYAAALEALQSEGLVYPAFMTRGDVREHAQNCEHASGIAYPRDPDGAYLYPGEEKRLSRSEQQAMVDDGQPFAWRLDMQAALSRTGPVQFCELSGDEGTVEVQAEPHLWGDVILARRDVPTSYHLSVVVDDALQSISHVVRGADLMPSTSVHRVLQSLLGLPEPLYHHHRLILDADGGKLSKSRGSTSLAALRAAGLTPLDIARMVGLQDIQLSASAEIEHPER
ncbi:tRNA glutamyl-Q(34) synthetase GluQRS [Aureimonas fodinaquatilis]|uniref:tRNA glutamyl-Q(34) synthetase GluQRS n=1 Tax=Aureimonas fodinaquatilis TaxID=2565783 RepID=A0A5B0E0P5_9HYPH|nr:tRNA glutamyl-Q(34) synthetase GluQRS [Aureimonas fodinaquatilis]KAA0972644.1 tRNA glutamyl-Q(34) synthetase GluQRS [Aureimonas fodinaquatilis]